MRKLYTCKDGRVNMDEAIAHCTDGYMVSFIADRFARVHVYVDLKTAERWLGHWRKLCEVRDPETAYRETILDSRLWN